MLWQNWVSTPAKCKAGKCRSNKNTTFALQVSHIFSISSSATPTWSKDIWYNLEHWHTPPGRQLQLRIQRGLGQGCLEKAECNISGRSRCNYAWHSPVGRAEYNPAKGSTCQLGWGMWLRASPPANNKTIYINRNLTKKWFPVRMEDVPMTQTSVKPKEPLR